MTHLVVDNGKLRDSGCVANARRPKAVVLLSGGIDSYVALAHAAHDGWDTHPLAVDYGQRHACELAAARLIAPRVTYLCEVVTMHAPWLRPWSRVPEGRSVREIATGGKAPTYVPARNTILLSLALSYAEHLGAAAVIVGANAADASGYPDCRPAFLEAFARLSMYATGNGRMEVLAPLTSMSKADVIRRGLELRCDLSLTHTCYQPDAEGRACGRCDACTIRLDAFNEIGMKDPGRYA